MTTATWLAIAILGPGALGVFCWFVADLRELLAPPEGDEDTLRDGERLR